MVAGTSSSSVELQALQCMEVWGGNRSADSGVSMPALEVFVFSEPHGSESDAEGAGGDVHFVSSCGTGRIARLVVADVSGHGPGVASVGRSLRTLMRRYMNYLDQTAFVAALNRAFASDAEGGAVGRFATSLAMTFFAPTGRLDLCNAGHPRPLYWSSRARRWSVLSAPDDADGPGDPSNLPLGILEPTRYEEFSVELGPGDVVVAYTDAAIEARGPDGRLLGEEGLLACAERLGGGLPAGLAAGLREELARYRGGSAADDDLTILVLHHTGRGTQRSFLARAWAGARFLGILARQLVPVGERPPVPWPEWRRENILGAIVPPVARRWRIAEGGPR